MTTTDIVVAGAGHNSLVAAAYLAKAGFGVVVVEARDIVGGDVATEELNLPGFLHDSCSTAHNILQASPTIKDDELGLLRNGLEYLQADPVVHFPFDDGTWLTMWCDIDQTCAEFAKFSKSDADTYREMMTAYDRVKGVFASYNYTPIGWGPTLDELLAAHPEGHRWRRLVRQSAADVILDAFEDRHTQTFMLWMASMTMQPPEREGTGRLAFALANGRQTNSWIVPRGGSGALAEALAAVIRRHGGEIVTGQTVTDLIVDGGRCVGITSATGDSYRAKQAVLSTIHVKHLVDMATPEVWGDEFTESVATWQPGLTMTVGHYATTEPPRFAIGEETVAPIAAGILSSPERLLESTIAFRRGAVNTTDPLLLVLCPTVVDPSRAPAGHHTLKVVGVQPYDLPPGPERWDEVIAEVATANLAQLRRYAPNVTEDRILAATLKSPLDLERFNAHNWHGSCHGGDQSWAQMGELRPAPGFADHRTPLPGLYQTGATTHPGGSVTAGPGRNAAMVMLHDLGSSLQAAIEPVASPVV